MTNTLRTALLHGAALGTALLATVPLAAQTAPGQNTPTQTAAADAPAGLGDIIVTARRREENLQQSPIAITAIDNATIENRFARNLNDLNGLSPNVQLDTGGAFSQTAFFSIRGISFQDVESSFDPAVLVSVDGVFIGRNVGSLTDLYDVEQIEILRGPQGTLFGRNSIGGAVLIRTARPTGKFGMKAQITGGDHGQFEVRGAVEGPIVADKIAAKVSALYLKNNGFWKNLVDDSYSRKTDVFAVRGTLRFTPTSQLTIDLIGDYSRDRSGSFTLVPANALPGTLHLSPGAVFTNLPAGVTPQSLVPPYSTFAIVGLGAGASPGLLNRFPDHPFDNYYSAPNKAPIDSGGGVIDAVYAGDNITVHSVTGYRKVNEDIHQDFDATALPIFETHRIQDQEQFSTELNFNTDFGTHDRFNLTAGVYYFDQTYNLTQYFPKLFFIPLPPQGLLNNITNQRSNSLAMYAEGSFKIIPSLTLTLGGRYTLDHKRFQTLIATAPGTFSGGEVTCTSSLSVPGYANCRASKDWEKFTPRAILAWQASDDINLYGSYSKGYKAGGFNGRAASGSSVGPFEPENVEAYEIGAKTQFWDRRIRFNVAAFRNNYSNLQVEVVRATTGGSGQETVVNNAASARTQGLEFEFTAAPARGLTVNANLGYLDAKYRDFISPIIANVGPGGTPLQVGYEDLSVFKLRRAPKWSWGLGGQYTADLGPTFKAAIRADYRHTSELFTTVRNQEFGRRRPLGLLDASIDIGTQDDRYKLSFFGRNLTNELYVGSALAIADSAVAYEGGLGAFSAFAPRRTVGVQLSVEFR